MIKRGFISLCAMLVLLGMGSCTRTEQPTGTVTLDFSIGDVVTRATTPGDGNAADGGGIAFDGGNPDLVILITRNGSIVSSYERANSETATATIESEESGYKRKRIRVTFTDDNLTQGDYTVYAVANTKNGGSTVWGAPSSWGGVASAQFSELTGNNRPVPAGDPLRMPLSAKGTLTVKSTGNGSVSLELLRCVAKVTVKFKNVTGGTLSLKDINFYISDMNPTWGYLIPPAGTDSPTSAGDFRPLEMSAAGPISIEDGTAIPGTYYVFPSQAQGGIYYCSASFTWKLNEGDEQTYENGYYATSDPLKGLRVFDKNYEDIPALLRNQHLTIEIRIGEGRDVSFNFIVGDWEEKTESVEFN